MRLSKALTPRRKCKGDQDSDFVTSCAVLRHWPQRVQIPPGELSFQPEAIGAAHGGNDMD